MTTALSQTELDFNEALARAERSIAEMPAAMFGDDVAPLEHSFGDGLYIRRITMPKGLLVTSARHKTTHPFFVLRGKVKVVSPEGHQTIVGPYQGMTKAGTKRLLYVLEETVWITVHATKETDIDKLRTELTESDHEQLRGGPCRLAQLEP